MNPTTQRANAIQQAMNGLFQVHEADGRHSPRAVVARRAAMLAFIANDGCSASEATRVFGSAYASTKPPRHADRALDLVGLVTVDRIWDVAEAIAGVDARERPGTDRRRSVVAARFIARVMMRKFLGMSRPEISRNGTHPEGCDGEVSVGLRAVVVDVVADRAEEAGGQEVHHPRRTA